jgi:hypothetical protein
MPRLSYILRKAGKGSSRGVCREWHFIKARLREAGDDRKHGNMMFEDFIAGYSGWDSKHPNIDPNSEPSHFALLFLNLAHQKAQRSSLIV